MAVITYAVLLRGVVCGALCAVAACSVVALRVTMDDDDTLTSLSISPPLKVLILVGAISGFKQCLFFAVAAPCHGADGYLNFTSDFV
jgi:hypothetical protein